MTSDASIRLIFTIKESGLYDSIQTFIVMVLLNYCLFQAGMGETYFINFRGNKSVCNFLNTFLILLIKLITLTVQDRL